MQYRYLLIALVTLCTSCSKWIIPEAIKNNRSVMFQVQPTSNGIADPGKFYTAEMRKTEQEYELVVTRTTGVNLYHLPSNKLNLISQLEANLKDLRVLKPTYVELTISSMDLKKIYRINTDIISDFIGGLKKKTN